MKKDILFPSIAFALFFCFAGCSKDNPYAGEWRFTHIGCLATDASISKNGDFDFISQGLVWGQVNGFENFRVVGSIDNDGDVSGSVFRAEEKFGTFTGIADNDSSMTGTYQTFSPITFGTTCSMAIEGQPLLVQWWAGRYP